MRVFRQALMGMLLLLASCGSGGWMLPAGAQTVVNQSPFGGTVGGFYPIGTVTGTGQVAQFFSFRNFPAAPQSYTVDWSTAGTAATACTFQAEGSSDGVHWYALTCTAPPTNCTAGAMMHIIFKPVLMFRINILTYTPGDSSTAISFRYTRGQST